MTYQCRNCGEPCGTDGGLCRGCGRSEHVTYEASEVGVLALCRDCDWRGLRSTRALAQRAFERHWYPAHRVERPVPLRNGTLVELDRKLSLWLATHERANEPSVNYCADDDCDVPVTKAGTYCRVHRGKR